MLLKSKAIATVTALSLMLGAAAPAQALGKNERNFLKGIAAVLIVGAIVNEGRKANAQPAPAPQPIYRQPRYEPPQPIYRQPRYEPPEATYRPHQVQPTQKTGRIIGQNSAYGSGVNDTTAARVFNSYSRAERLAIQRQLAGFGYYSGAIDGAFGPRTHQAVYEFAGAMSKQDALNTTSGAYRVYDALLG
jgi:hypothetical protein